MKKQKDGENATPAQHDQVQAACWELSWNKYPVTRLLLWHSNNEMDRLPGESAKMHMIRVQQARAKGVVAGVWDLVLYWHGRLIIWEIKIGKDTLSDRQKQFRDKVIEHGGKWFILDADKLHENLKHFEMQLLSVMGPVQQQLNY